jgi:hypothetical protein
VEVKRKFLKKALARVWHRHFRMIDKLQVIHKLGTQGAVGDYQIGAKLPPTGCALVKGIDPPHHGHF